MKKQSIIHLAILAVAAGTVTMARAGDLSKYTADYYKATYATHADKEITLKVAAVKPPQIASPVDGVQFFVALTADSSADVEWGGSIIVAVAADKAENFVRKYGTNIDWDGGRWIGGHKADTRRMEGTLRVLEGGLIYLDTGDNTKAINEHAEEVRKLIRATAGHGKDGGRRDAAGRIRPFR